jgi:hypothetical protein
MQKLSGKTSVMLYKSSGICHKESNKIWFEFLWFFYDFVRIL